MPSFKLPVMLFTHLSIFHAMSAALAGSFLTGFGDFSGFSSAKIVRVTIFWIDFN